MPDAEVVETLEQLLEAAREGLVRSVAIIAINPASEAEIATAGDLSGSKRLIVMGCCKELSDMLSSYPKPA